jgi:hypothetical protein
MFPTAPFWFLWIVVAVLALAGVRRTAVAGALVISAAQFGFLVWTDDYWGGVAAVPILVGLVMAAALVLVLLERLVIRAAFVSGVDAGRAAGTRAD